VQKTEKNLQTKSGTYVFVNGIENNQGLNKKLHSKQVGTKKNLKAAKMHAKYALI
jgi:hypothetical protein